MKIDWNLALKITVPLFALVLGRFLDLWFAKKSKLIFYVGHASAFRLEGQDQIQIYTHAVVIRNAGRETAHNVRIGHNFLPENYQIFPPVPHEVVDIPNSSGKEIIIQTLVSNEQITISYLYFPPITYDKINSYTKSDEGFAKTINVVPTPLPAKWVIKAIWVVIFIGVVAILYVFIDILRHFL
ncbi:MAG: hypothetical protein ACYCT9_07150 [Leptospirillum sp.]